MKDRESLINLFQKELPRILPHYEERKGQVAMAILIAECLAERKNLLVEAGTGIGKTLAYLLPLIQHGRKENKRVVISTYTKILQEQLVKKDIPIAQRLIPFRFASAYGSENYFCPKRANNSLRYGLFEREEERYLKDKIFSWVKEKEGLLIDFPENIEPNLLNKINRDRDNCLEKRCPFYEECYYFRAKKKWEEAEVLVINHFLFFAHCATDYKLLPKFDTIVFDEAHRLEDAGVNYFGIDLSNNGLKRSLELLYNLKTKKGLLNHLPLSLSLQEHWKKRLEKLNISLNDFFLEITEQVAERKRILAPLQLASDFIAELEDLNLSLLRIYQEMRDDDLKPEVWGLIKSLKEKEKELKEFVNLGDSGSVYWWEREGGRIYLKSAPLSIVGMMKKILSNFKVFILTSATLTVAGDFSFLANRLGMEEYQKSIFPSPFDYEKQSLLFIDERLPFPKEEGDFIRRCAQSIDELIKIARGRTLILFTSFKMMEEVFALCRKGEYQFLKQGEEPAYQLLKRFQEDTTSCLFATASFWQGIDVPGEALSCLIITRLPFDVPDEPRIEGIVENLRRRGEEPFWSFQLPQAVLRFRQGFGRLIRNKRDRGVVGVLDKRIIRKNYGHLFLRSLPENLPMTTNINPVVGFFRRR
jgi:ATP-dependent DNA helicase DinG